MFISSGFYSWRNSKSGSCFIQTLCNIMNKYSEQLDLLTMMTFVNRSVSYFFGLHKMYIVRVFSNSTRILCELTICYQVSIGYESNVPKSPPQHAKKQTPHVSHTLMRQVYLVKKPHGTLV